MLIPAGPFDDMLIIACGYVQLLCEFVRVTDCVAGLQMFVMYSMLGGDRGELSGMGDRGKSMNFRELKQLLIDVGVYPSKNHGHASMPPSQRMLTPTVLAKIFEGVNDNLEDMDGDAHEFSYEEFYVAMCLIAVYCNRSQHMYHVLWWVEFVCGMRSAFVFLSTINGLMLRPSSRFHAHRPMEAIIFPGTLKGEALTEMHQNQGFPVFEILGIRAREWYKGFYARIANNRQNNSKPLRFKDICSRYPK